MQLSHKAITSFQKLYQEKCGVKLNLEEAAVMALKELKRFSLIYRPVPINDKYFFSRLHSTNNKEPV